MIFALLAISLWIIRAFFAIKKARLESDFERIRLNVSKFGFKAEKIEEISAGIQSFEENYALREKEIKDISNEIELLEREIKNARDKDLQEIDNDIESSRIRRDEIKIKSGVESLEEYQKNLSLKQENEKLRDEQIVILKSYFEADEESLEESIKRWATEIEKLKVFKDKAAGVKYDESLASELKSVEGKYKEKRENLLTDMESYKKKLYEIESSANRILQLKEDRLPCNTYMDLESIKKILEDFVTGVEDNKDRVLKAIRIFEEIEREEEEEVHTLFGDKSMVSRYFSEITGKIYVEVEFLPEERKIFIKQKNRKILDAEKTFRGSIRSIVPLNSTRTG